MDPFPSECRESTPPLGAEWATLWPGSRACPGVLRPFITVRDLIMISDLLTDGDTGSGFLNHSAELVIRKQQTS